MQQNDLTGSQTYNERGTNPHVVLRYRKYITAIDHICLEEEVSDRHLDQAIALLPAMA
jgi:hypothetical protein